MDVKITVKIKIAKGKEIVLNSEEAEALYFELKKIYDKPYYITYPYTYTYSSNSAKPADNCLEITCSNN